VGDELTFAPKTNGQLGYEIAFPGGQPNRCHLITASFPDERFLGFGEQFNHVDHKGKRVPILSREQGIGRGLQPLTSVLNRLQGVGGDWDFTYAAIPFTFTSQRRGFFLEDSEYSVFDLRDPYRARVKLFAGRMKGRLLWGRTLLDILNEFTSYSGRMPVLPDWIHQGAVIGMTGGEQRVRAMEQTLRSHGVPVSGFFLQDWVGERSTPFGTRLWWNWIRDLDGMGYRTLSYVNPWLVDAGSKPGAVRNLYQEALTLGYLVRDRSGGLHSVDQGGYRAALVDLSNPAAFAWLKDVVKQQVLATGVSGWMGDFGEGLPLDAQIHSGDAASYHNRYPEEWARLQQEAVREAGRTGDVVYFSRSGFTRSPGLTPLFWAGDQLTTWDEHDGLKSSIVGLMTSGLSGMTLNHSDIGGYTTIGIGPWVLLSRPRELFHRWMEVNAFTPVFRTHQGLHPNAGQQLDSDPGTLAQFARMAKVFKALFPYRKALMLEAEQRGAPLVRHPYLHDAADVLLQQKYAFMLGSEYFVAPVVDPGRSTVDATLPRGRWVHLWSGQVHGSHTGNARVTVPAPVGRPAVFYREGSAEGARFVQELARLGVR
jgi:alpha-glucosidase